MPRDLTSYWGQFSSLSLENDVLKRKLATKDGEISRILICVPEEKQEEILKMCHSTLLVNHPGIKNTLEICRKHFYWPVMTKDVKMFVNTCITCGYTSITTFS